MIVVKLLGAGLIGLLCIYIMAVPSSPISMVIIGGGICIGLGVIVLKSFGMW